jgi:single-stranded-DNA-specific exonuclease
MQHIQKKWILRKAENAIVNELQREMGIHRTLCELLERRGVHSIENAQQFFQPDVNQLHDPFLMKDMQTAVERLSTAIENKEKILIYGDYDVDGTTSVAMMYHFLSQHHKHLSYYIPDRYSEGYGVSMQGIEFAHQNGFTLMIAIDCGINAIEQVEKAKTLGVDFIICDHHLTKEKLPEAIAVLDPKRQDCPYPFKELSGCGVAFKLIQGYLKYKKMPTKALNEVLDFLVVSIACDIVPIIGENRTLAYFGLKKINSEPSSGLRALIGMNKRNFPLSISDIVFGIGPSINAAGRLADAKLAVRLLLSNEKRVALMLSEELHHKNEKRKDLEYQIIRAAMAQFENQDNWQAKKSIVVYEENWHKGVVGIVASKLVDKFQRPSIVLTESNGQVVGSARSVSGYDVHRAIESCEAHLVNFGGHKYAAGLTMNKENLPHFKNDFEAFISQTITKKELTPTQYIDGEIDLQDITPEFLQHLAQFSPFGPHNRRPVFLTRNVSVSGTMKILKDLHLKFSAQQADSKTFECIGFGMSGLQDLVAQPSFDMCYVIEEQHWKGKKRIQLRLKDIKRPADSPPKELPF